MDVFHNNITDIQQQETVDEDNNNFVSKYYNWQMKLGDIIFSGTRTSDCTSSYSHATPISSLSLSTSSGIKSFMKLGRVKDINGLFFGIPDVNDVIDIFTFAKLNLLSQSGGDQLLQLLKDIIRRHSQSIQKYFIYDRIENLNGAITKAVSQIYHGININITLPSRLCGSDQHEKDQINRILDFRNRNLSEYIIAKGNGLNVVDLIAEFLILLYSIDEAMKHRYHIHRPIYQDSRQVSNETNNCFNVLIRNLLRDIPLPTEKELQLFKSYSNPDDANVDNTDEIVDVDVVEH